jgi:hypothetical protein
MPDERWTPQRLQSLIDQRIEENNELDYKRAAALDAKHIEDITKDVSSFANSAGGRIIYGIKEFDEPMKKHLPEAIDPIDNRKFSREWLDHIIGEIKAPIEGLKITPVRIGPEDWQTCYVVDIPKGETAHQAKDCRYYRRYNFKAVPMPDHEVRDVMNRRKHPKLELSVRLARTHVLTVSFRVLNQGKVVPSRYGIVVLLPTVIQKKLYKAGLRHQMIEGKHFWRFMVIGREPVFPEADAYCEEELPFESNMTQNDPVANFLICTLYADEMPPVQRKVQIEHALLGWV